jgi:hypothetical protein
MEGWKDGRMEGWKDGRMEGWKDGRMEGWMEGWKEWKDGRMEGWKDGRMEGWKDQPHSDHRGLRASFSLLSVKWPISERSEKGGQVKSRRLILNSVFCFLTSALAVRIEFEFEFEFEFEWKRERGTGQNLGDSLQVLKL